MKNLTLSLGLFLGMITTFSLSAAPQFGVRDNRRICVYEHNNFSGWEQCFVPGENIGDLGNHRNAISSIRLFGDARVTLFANKNYEGASLQVTSDLRDLAQVKMPGLAITGSWNDRVESLQVTAPYDSRTSRNDPVYRDDRIYRDERIYRDDPLYRDDRSGNRQNGVCVFEETNYRGQSTCFYTGEAISDLARSGKWSDRISSIRIQGPTRVILYRDINFLGDKVTIDRDIPDLKQLRLRGTTWDNQISSLDVYGGRGNAYGRNNRRYR